MQSQGDGLYPELNPFPTAKPASDNQETQLPEAVEASTVPPAIPLSQFLQALEACHQPARRNPYYSLPSRKALRLMLAGPSTGDGRSQMRDHGRNPDYRLKLYEDGAEDSGVLAVDVESLRQGENLPENAYVKLPDVALFFLSRIGGGFIFSSVPWSNGEGNPCRISNPEEALEGKARYIDYQEAKAIINRVLRADPPTEEEIAFWLGTGMLTAWEHEYANACPADCQKQNHDGMFAHAARPAVEEFPESLSYFANIIPQLDTYYFSKPELESFRPTCRWRSYGYVLAAAAELGFNEAQINRLAWNSPIGRLRQYYLIENFPDSLSNPRCEEALQPVEVFLSEHLYPSAWVKALMDKLAQGRDKAKQRFKTAGFSLAAKPEDYDHALKQDAWAIWEALCWLNGDNPFYYRRNVKDDYPVEMDLVERAVNAGILTPQSTSPRQWIEWALSKGWAVPEPLREYVEAQRHPAQEAPDPRRLYPQAFGTRITVAELRQRWGLSHNKYLDEMARLRELIPFYHDGLNIDIRPKGLACEFGIPPAAQWVNTGTGHNAFVSYDIQDVAWVDTLPDDAYYGLPFVFAHEEKYPELRPKAESDNDFPQASDRNETKAAALLNRYAQQRMEILADLARQPELDMVDVLFILGWSDTKSLESWPLSRGYEIDENGICGRLAPGKTRLEFPCTPKAFIDWCKEEEKKRDNYGLKLYSLLFRDFVPVAPSKSEPGHDPSQIPNDRIVKKAALIEMLKPLLKEGRGLESLLSNANKMPALSACKQPNGRGWRLVCLLRFLASNGYLKEEKTQELGTAGFEQLLKNLKS